MDDFGYFLPPPELYLPQYHVDFASGFPFMQQPNFPVMQQPNFPVIQQRPSDPVPIHGPLPPVPLRESSQKGVEGKEAKKSKRPKRKLVVAKPGDFILCRWGKCYELIEAKETMIQRHAKLHLRRDGSGKCLWNTPGTEECKGKEWRDGNIGKHLSSHLHQEGQPSPWVGKCPGCNYICVMRGSGRKHLSSCSIGEKKAKDLKVKSKGGQKMRT